MSMNDTLSEGGATNEDTSHPDAGDQSPAIEPISYEIRADGTVVNDREHEPAQSATVSPERVAITIDIAASAPEDEGAASTSLAPLDGAQLAVAKKRVLVIDDELCGLQYSHLSRTMEPILEDLNSPQVTELWAFLVANKGFKEHAVEDPKVIHAYIASQAIIDDVILNADFQKNMSPELKEDLTFFLDRVASAAVLRDQISKAFAASVFEVEFVRERPVVSDDLLRYDLLILDLVLEEAHAPIDDMVRYLSELGNYRFPTPLPCLIVMSNFPGLIEHQIRFSAGAKISAAGLMILSKHELARQSFGSVGLGLSYSQLDRQRKVSQAMRVFMRTWITALDAAKGRAAEAIWNLDASAMQELHLVAFNDHDPYDEFLNALMVREYLWHVESDPTVGSAIEILDATFQEQLKKGAKAGEAAVIQQRFIAPFVQPKHGRELVGHFTWTGMPLPKKLADMSTSAAMRSFNTLVPFGAVLAPAKLTPATDCFIHITQQCDLNQEKDRKSVQFAIARPILVKDHDIKPHDSELVARGLMIGGNEYDLVLEKGRQLALPMAHLINYAKQKKLSVVGRLRHDVASHFLLATANHMTRWAAQKVVHPQTLTVELYMHGDKFPNGHVVFRDEVLDEVHVLQLSVKGKKKTYYFQDNISIKISIWVAQELQQHYGDHGIDADVVCNQLSVGVSHNSCLAKFLHLKVATLDQKSRKNEYSVAKADKKMVSLICVSLPEPES